MNNRQYYEEFQKQVDSDLTSLLKFLPTIVPCNDDDKKLLSIGTDMLESMLKDVKDGNLNDVFDMESVIDDWDKLNANYFNSPNNKDIMDLMDDIVEKYGNEQGEYSDE